MMEKLTLENISPYLPYGLKGLLKLNREEDFSEYDFDFEKFKKGTVWGYIGYAEGKYNIPMGEGYIDGMIYGNENTYVNFQYGIKPILRPMNLTQAITVDGKEIVPIVELAKIMWGDNIEIGNFRKSGNYQVCEINPNSMNVLRHLIFDDDGFHHSSPKHREPPLNQIRTCPNQKELWKWLYAHKFDVDGLIEKGLAIDVNTLETNPYNF